MDYKHKHFSQMRKAVLLTTVAAMTLSCSKSKKTPDYSSGDMLSLSEITDKDMGGNLVVLEKINIPLCDENKRVIAISLLSWGIADIPVKERHEKTYATPFYVGGELHYAETYGDGVLKSFPAMMIAEQRLRVIGNERTYARNLAEIHARQAEKEREKAIKRMQNRRKWGKDGDIAFVVEKNGNQNSDSAKEDSLFQQVAEKEDTLQIQQEKEIFADRLQNDTVAVEDSLNNKKAVYRNVNKPLKSFERE